MLTQLMIDAPSGRSGSTLLMQLLGTSDQIAFDRIHPFESRYLSHALNSSVLPFASAVAGDPQQLALDTFKAMWDVYEQRLYTAFPAARYYAEKLLVGVPAALVLAAGGEARVIELVRDPRDMLVSIRAFDAKRGYFGFGRAEGQTEADFFDQYVRTMNERFHRLGRDTSGRSILVRYEDMVSDLPAVATRIGDWLGCELDAALGVGSAEQRASHGTSSSPSASVGRWKSELSPLDAREIGEIMGVELARLGYEH